MKLFIWRVKANFPVTATIAVKINLGSVVAEKSLVNASVLYCDIVVAVEIRIMESTSPRIVCDGYYTRVLWVVV